MYDIFGKTTNGEIVNSFQLSNSTGLEMNVITYGGIITSLLVPSENGEKIDVVLGCNSLDEYINNTSYLGAIIGRYGNRIGGAKFSLDGNEYQLAKNDNDKNHLHGGFFGFDKKIWSVENVNQNSISLAYLSKDGEENYPGNLNVRVIYTLTDDNELVINYFAETDKPTVCNLTQHTYFNLNGYDSGDILNHKIMINAEHFTPTDAASIPTGEIRSVENSALDFRKTESIGKRISNNEEQLIFAGGYDHNFCLSKNQNNELSLAATVLADISAIKMDVLTTEPGLQFYTGNYLDGSITGKSNLKINYRNGLCLETQHFPDSPNKPNFPTTRLNPGEKYFSKTIYKFTSSI